MKLINKLLPLGCVATIASIIAPLTTSCAANETIADGASYTFDYEYNLKKSKIVTPLTPYASKVTPAELVDVDGIDADTAKQIYFDKLDEDKGVFADDLMCGFYNALIDVYGYPIQKYEGNAKAKVISFDSETGKISFWISTKCNFERSTHTLSGSEIVPYSIDRTIEINNLPIIPMNINIQRSEMTDCWNIIPNLQSEEDLEDATIKVNDVCYIDGEPKNGNVVWNIDNMDATIPWLNYFGDQSGILNAETFLKGFFSYLMPSHYLINNYPEGL